MSKQTPFKIHPSLAIEKVFSYAPSPAIELDEKTKPLPSDWLTALSKMCFGDRQTQTAPPNNPFFLNPFKKHIDRDPPLTPYESEAALKKQLAIIYHRLTGDLDATLGKLSASERRSILSKLTEEIGACTAGFHNRVNYIVTAMQLPSSLIQLLCKVRLSLVLNTAATLTSEVHASNRVTSVAQAIGLGVSANLGSDPYVGNLDKNTIIEALKEKFESEYTPFNLPIFLSEELRGVLDNFGYIGRKEGKTDEDKGYDIGDAIAFALLIQSCLVNPESNKNTTEKQNNAWYTQYFIIEEFYDEVKDVFKTYIKDINWPKINRLFLASLEREAYFTSPPIPEQLWEFSYYRSEEETLDAAKKLFAASKTPKEKEAVFQQIKKMRDICPDSYSKLVADEAILPQLSEYYFALLEKLFKSEKNYSAIFMELEKLKQAAPALYEKILQSPKLTPLINDAVNSVSPTNILAKMKARIVPPSLLSISQIVDLLLVKTAFNKTDSETNIRKVIATLKDSNKYWSDQDLFAQKNSPARNFNAAIAIVNKLYHYDLAFNNDTILFLKRFITSEHKLIQALKQFPQEAWIPLIETPDLNCPNTFKFAVYFILEKKIDFKNPADFLAIYNTLEKISEHHAKDFSQAISTYLTEHPNEWKNPGFLLYQLHQLNDNPESFDIINPQLQEGLKHSTKEAWIAFLTTKKYRNLNIVLELAKFENSESLREALVALLQPDMNRRDNPFYIPTSNANNTHQQSDYKNNLFSQLLTLTMALKTTHKNFYDAVIASLINYLQKGNTILELLVPFASETFLAESWNNLFKLALDSKELRNALIQRMSKEVNWHWLGYQTAVYVSESHPHQYNQCRLGSRSFNLLTDQLTTLLCQALREKEIANEIHEILNTSQLKRLEQVIEKNGIDRLEMVYCCNNACTEWMGQLISKLSCKDFASLLSAVKKGTSINLLNNALQMKIGNIEQVKINLVAKLYNYINSNLDESAHPAKDRPGFFTLPTTKQNIAEARKLIQEITNCHSFLEIHKKISARKEESQKINAQRSLAFARQNVYADCLERCDNLVLRCLPQNAAHGSASLHDTTTPIESFKQP